MRRVLVGLDASPRAEQVLDYAMELVRKTGGQLVLLHAYSLPVGLPVEVYAISPDTLPDVLERNARALLDNYAARVPAGVLAGVRAALGTPWQQICSAAREENVDLIIIGSHGYHGLDRILGTNASRVVNHADRPVLVVHQEPETPAHTP
jgi:nucleotide-binding universal stress UspA family protein